MIDSATRILGVLGKPIKHSLSPRIQNHFIKENNINACYHAFEISETELKVVMEGAKALGFSGFNITMPFKKKVIEFLDEISEDAEDINAVNTIRFDQVKDKAQGFNTDGKAVIRSLEDNSFEWDSKNILIIGAGGAAKSAIYSILKKPVEKIFIYNRTVEKAETILKRFAKYADNKIEVLKNLELERKEIERFDLIINCTPLGMDGVFGERIPIPIEWDLSGKTIFDMVYNPVNTRLVKKALKDDAEIVTGIDMLINQAAYSFSLWFGIVPDIKKIRKVLINEYR